MAVVGGGPAGMRAALFCRQRGHSVVLFEKTEKLGGQLYHTDYTSFKWTLRRYRDYLKEQLVKTGVEVRMNTEASPEMIESEGFDAVIEFASRRRRAILHIYRSVSWDVFERKLMQVCEYFVRSYVDTALAQEPISPEDRKTIIDYYKCVCFGLTVDWLDSGMSEQYMKSIRRIFLLKRDMATEAAVLLRDQV